MRNAPLVNLGHCVFTSRCYQGSLTAFLAWGGSEKCQMINVIRRNPLWMLGTWQKLQGQQDTCTRVTKQRCHLPLPPEYSQWSNKETRHDVMLEAVFPSSAIFRLMGKTLREDADALSLLASGMAHHKFAIRVFVAGSTKEGLAMSGGWGHGWPDMDLMELYGAQLGVHIPQRHKPRKRHTWGTISTVLSNLLSKPLGSFQFPLVSSNAMSESSCLEYAPEGCESGYTRLLVSDKEGLMDHLGLDDYIVEELDGQHWLHTSHLHMLMEQAHNKNEQDAALRVTSVSGPAGEVTTPTGGMYDNVPTLVTDGPHPALGDYLHRPRCPEWPSRDQLREIRQLPMCLVLVGHKASNENHLKARVSCSVIELILTSKLPNLVKQGFIAFKNTFKSSQKDYSHQKRTGDNRSQVGSYHLKTILLHYLEKTPPSQITSSFCLMIDLLSDLDKCLTLREIPHYLIPQCNLLGTVGPDERQAAHQTIHAIISDPVAAVINSPSEPHEIYGDISPFDLIAAFRQVSLHPSCERSCDTLIQLLRRLDDWRRRRYYNIHLPLDEEFGMSGRPEPTGLVDMLRDTRYL